MVFMLATISPGGQFVLFRRKDESFGIVFMVFSLGRICFLYSLFLAWIGCQCHILLLCIVQKSFNTVCKIVFHQRGSRETYFKKIVTGKVITQRYRLISKLLLIIKVAYQCHFQSVPVVCNTQSLASSLCHTPGKAFLFGSDKKSTKSRVWNLLWGWYLWYLCA